MNRTPAYKDLMPYNRFMKILQHLHVNDNEEDKRTGRSDKKSPNYDALYKVWNSWFAQLREEIIESL